MKDVLRTGKAEDAAPTPDWFHRVDEHHGGESNTVEGSGKPEVKAPKPESQKGGK